jgi:hypothetical protein
VFVKKLTPLIPGLTHLSDSVVKAIGTLLGPSDQINAGLTRFGHGIEWLAGYIGSDDFQTTIKDFVTGVGKLSDSVVLALRFLGVISTPNQDAITEKIARFFEGDGKENNRRRCGRSDRGRGTQPGLRCQTAAAERGGAAVDRRRWTDNVRLPVL